MLSWDTTYHMDTFFDEIMPRLETALASTHPRARLQHLMSELLEKGWERDILLPALEAFRAHLAAQSRATDEELILEVIDGFARWC